jgi:hypothetical protein
MKINRIATIVQFRAIYDVTDAGELDRLAHEVMAAKGTVLGTTGDGCDVVAAFPNARYAAAFLTSNGIEPVEATFEVEHVEPAYDPRVYFVRDGNVNGVEGERAIVCGAPPTAKPQPDGWYFIPRGADDGEGPFRDRREAIDAMGEADAEEDAAAG